MGVFVGYIFNEINFMMYQECEEKIGLSSIENVDQLPLWGR